MATRPTRPKGYLTKGKTTSPDAARKVAARKELTSARGLAGMVVNAVLNGAPAGRGVKAVKGGSKLMLTVRRNIRKAAAGSEKRAVVPNREATLVATGAFRAPVKRNRDLVGQDAGRGLSAAEKKEVQRADTITRPKPNKPKSKENIAINQQKARKDTIRKSLTIQKPPGTTKEFDARKHLPGHKVTVNTPKVRKVDATPPKAESSRSDSAIKERLDAATLKRDSESVELMHAERRSSINDIRAGLANPKRYSTPRKEAGNRQMAERLASIGEDSMKKGLQRKALERTKVGNTAKAKSKVDSTLDSAAASRAAAARRNRIDSRKSAIRRKRGE